MLRFPTIGRFNFSTLSKSRFDSNLIQIKKAKIINEGKQIMINFSNNSQYIFHCSWMKDSAPNNIGSDFYRSKLYDLLDFDQYSIKNININDNGDSLSVLFQKLNGVGVANDDTQCYNTYPSQWLHSFAPFVGSIEAGGDIDQQMNININGTDSLFRNIYEKRKPWDTNKLKISKFNANDIMGNDIMSNTEYNYDNALDFFEKLVDPGICVIENMDDINIDSLGDELDDGTMGIPLTKLIELSVGKLRIHHSRKNLHWIIRSNALDNGITDDYNQRNPLAMHTDHSFFNGTSAYLIWMHQFKGDVISKVCDGLAVAKYIKEYYPNEFNLLSTINVTHSFRNVIYSKDGDLRTTLGNNNVSEFETIQTHPIIQIDNNNNIKRIVHSESKRGVCAIPFDIYDEYMNAYKLWCQLVDDDRFIVKVEFNENNVIVMNNWRLLHGRATMVNQESDRILVGAYTTREIFDNRYRYLHQKRIENKNDLFCDKKSTTRIPNQVLSSLIEK
eukprot:290715_1